MLTLLLVAGALAVIALALVAITWALRHGEEQDRQTRHIDPHGAYWGTDHPYPARARRARHAAAHTPRWARTDHHRRTP